MCSFAKYSGALYKKTCVVILALMVIIVFVNTMLRYFFHSGIAQNEEILRYLFIWLSFLGIVAVYKEGGHICVTLLTERLSPKGAAIMALCVNAMTLIAFGVLIAGSTGYMEESASMVGELTGLPYRCIIAAILLAAVACFCLNLRNLVTAWKAVRAGGLAYLPQNRADEGDAGRDSEQRESGTSKEN